MGWKMKYHFTRFEKIIDYLLMKGYFRYPRPQIEYQEREGYLEFQIPIEGKNHIFNIRKDGLKTYELQAAYVETFYNSRVNGHSYMRREIPINIGDTVLDGGGCEGFFARYALEKGADKVIVIEPCEKLADGICKTFHQEINEGRVIVVTKALGSKPGKQTLVINEDMYCASNLGYLEVPANKAEESIIVDRLDSIVEELKIPKIDLIKMDIEGAEMDALIGAENVIKQHRPKMMIATYHGYTNSIECESIVKSMRGDYKSKFCGYYTYEEPYRPYLTLFF